MKSQNLRMSIFAVMLLAFLTCGCSIKAHIHEEYGYEYENKLNYEIPFEEGYVLNENGKIRIILKFYESGKFYQGTDANHSLNYYICTTNQNLKNSEVFMIEVLTHVFFGEARIDRIDLNAGSKDRLELSADIKSKAIFKEGNTDESNLKKNISFQKLPLKIVKTYEELAIHIDELGLYKMNELSKMHDFLSR